MVPGAPYRPKDFALVKRDGLYHLFYIRRNVNLPYAQTENDLGHAVSRDLWIWKQLDPVVPARPGMWDAAHIWAPSVVERDGVYYLFYTGVVDSFPAYNMYQRTGVATSTDLLTWNRMDDPVYTCDDTPWSVCDSLNGTAAFRDPFVMADPRTPGAWLMYTAQLPAADSSGMVVGVAGGTDLLHWSDLGPLWITNRAWTGNDVVESPMLLAHAGLWYLFVSTWAKQPIQFGTATDPVAPPEQWTWRGSLGAMLGYDTSAWFAPEHLGDGLVDYLGYVVADRIEVYRMDWSGEAHFVLSQPDFMHVQCMKWSADSVAEQATVTLSITASAWQSRRVALEVVAGLDGGPDTVIAPHVLGLPDTLALFADTSRVAWNATRLADPADPTRGGRVTLRLADQTAATKPLAIAPGPPAAPPDPEPDDHLQDRPRDHAPPPAPPAVSGTVVTLRALRDGGLLLEARRPVAARLDLFDLQGRRVRTLVERVLPEGATVVAWDGRDAAGAAVGAGIYFARLVTQDRVAFARLLRTR